MTFKMASCSGVRLRRPRAASRGIWLVRASPPKGMEGGRERGREDFGEPE